MHQLSVRDLALVHAFKRPEIVGSRTSISSFRQRFVAGCLRVLQHIVPEGAPAAIQVCHLSCSLCKATSHATLCPRVLHRPASHGPELSAGSSWRRTFCQHVDSIKSVDSYLQSGFGFPEDAGTRFRRTAGQCEPARSPLYALSSCQYCMAVSSSRSAASQRTLMWSGVARPGRFVRSGVGRWAWKALRSGRGTSDPTGGGGGVSLHPSVACILGHRAPGREVHSPEEMMRMYDAGG